MLREWVLLRTALDCPLLCPVKLKLAALFDNLTVLAIGVRTEDERVRWRFRFIRNTNKLRQGPAFHRGVPIRVYISGAPLPILQIDWPLRPRDCCVIGCLEQSIECKVSVRSFTPKNNLEID